MSSLSIERCETLSFEDYITHFAIPQKPVVLVDVCKQWPALEKWSFDFLSQHYGNFKVKVLVCQPLAELNNFNSYREYKNSTRSFLQMTLREYLKYLENDSDQRLLYLIDWHIHKIYGTSKLLNDFQVPIYFANKNTLKTKMDQFFRWIFIGKKGTYSRIHLDVFNTAAWNAIITGKKRWVFYPPNTHELAHQMNINVLFPDYERYPFLKENRYECITNPGDVIYTPSLWFHAVENLETGISLTQNYVDKWNYTTVLDSLKEQVWYKHHPIKLMLKRKAKRLSTQDI